MENSPRSELGGGQVVRPTATNVALIQDVIMYKAGGVNHFRNLRQTTLLFGDVAADTNKYRNKLGKS
jgi:hypothetical protein